MTLRLASLALPFAFLAGCVQPEASATVAAAPAEPAAPDLGEPVYDAGGVTILGYSNDLDRDGVPDV